MGTVQFKVGSQNLSEIFVQRVRFCDLTYRNIVARARSTKMNVFHRVYMSKYWRSKLLHKL